MIDHPNYDVDPWSVRETALNLGTLAQSESVFALSNGHIGLRGNLDEGDPSGLAGTYLNGFHEVRPLPYAETAYGNPEAGETVLNVTDGKLLRLLVDDELFDVRYGDLLEHERELDFRAGVLRRSVHWRGPSGREVRIRSTRLVSLAQRGAVAILYEVEPVGISARVVVQSELVANDDGQVVAPDDDPRAAAALRAPLHGEESYVDGLRVSLVHRTAHSQIRMCATMDHEISGPDVQTGSECGADMGRVTIAADVGAGETLRVLKYVAYGWSHHRSLPSVRAQAHGSLAEARHTGWQGLLDLQRAYLDAFWERADVEVEGDEALQQAVRFSLFHVLQASARGEGRAIPAKGLTGSGYDGHAFWDTESFVLPLLTYSAPHAAAYALRWRRTTLEQARERAHQLGLAGAAFPWRTIAGRECSGYWPAGTAAFHVNADIAVAVLRYQHAADDPAFERDVGLPLLVETARLWHSLGHQDLRGSFRIPGVTGPDEYSALADDNVYTNLMARLNLLGAADAADRWGDEAAELHVDDAEVAAWRHAAAATFVPYDTRLDVHQQARGFTEHAVWDFEHTQPDQYPLLLHFPYFDLYRKQVVKQADLVLALYVCGDRFTDAEKVRDFAYYEALTVRDSSLSACVQAIVAAETGHLELAYDYLGEAALMDLQDLEHNTRDGLHIASLAGSWLALVAGFGGFRDHGGVLTFAPRLPPALQRLAFRLNVRGARLHVEVVDGTATYTLAEGRQLELAHHRETLTVRAGEPQSRAIPPAPQRPRPSQPRGREPRRRGSVTASD
ncbi:MAG TPA: glycosyl hydrolase family 65 protein [Baekduia sp.]|uniref:glycoside hydrolase family 65 protein n=1 Tax=Baekduia sp. TaxID=2600305 RepID=UPI002CE1E6D8|nr:glycosyl hydrolase family 65 protein [Baekduia sp.]HMJ37370.1 glycosyl hydrolase family 65 protein [Baekduia sp.]